MDIIKELRKLNRKELLEILLEQTKRIEDLESKITETEKKLESKLISLSESGTLADAALKLSNIFKDADESIAIYKVNMEEKLLKKAELTAEKCEIKEKETKIKCQNMISEAEAKLKELEKKIKKIDYKKIKE